MKKSLFMLVMLMMGIVCMQAQKVAEITFESTTHNFGTFSESEPKQTCEFKFKNTGNAILVIHQAIASCGCTVPTYTKQPIRPGETGNIKVTYNGAGKFPGHFKKAITLRTNAKTEMVRLYIEGDMTEKELDVKEIVKDTAKK